MNLFLRRFGTARCTAGFLYAAGEPWVVHTLERPWLENAPFISCVPEGLYDLVPHSSEAHPNVWALVGETVSHWGGEGKARSAILIHPANWLHQLKGCIAPGMGSYVHDHDGFQLEDSRTAMDMIRRSLSKDGKHTLAITRG